MNRVLFEALYVQEDKIVGARLTRVASVLFHDGEITTWGHVPTPPDEPDGNEKPGSVSRAVRAVDLGRTRPPTPSRGP